MNDKEKTKNATENYFLATADENIVQHLVARVYPRHSACVASHALGLIDYDPYGQRQDVQALKETCRSGDLISKETKHIHGATDAYTSLAIFSSHL